MYARISIVLLRKRIARVEFSRPEVGRTMPGDGGDDDFEAASFDSGDDKGDSRGIAPQMR